MCIHVHILSITEKLHSQTVATGSHSPTGPVLWLYLVSSPLAVIHGHGERRVDAPHGLHSALPFSWDSRVSIVTLTLTVNSKGIFGSVALQRPWDTTPCQRQRRQLTIFSFMLVMWGIRLLQGASSLPATTLVCFPCNTWLLEGGTWTGNICPLVGGPMLCWLELLNVTGITFHSYKEELFSWNVTSIDIRRVVGNKMLDLSVDLWKLH